MTDATRVRTQQDRPPEQGLGAAAGPLGHDVLDNVIWTALTGPQAGFADRSDRAGAARAAQFQPEVAPFAAMAGGPGEWAWDDLAAVVGPGGVATLFFVEDAPPAGWTVLDRIGLVQMVATAAFTDAPEPAARPLGPADVPAMIELVERTKPGPFRSRTVELGSYLGVFEGDTLVAMAGERLRVPGYTEISAVCTDPALRGQGLATRLMRAVATGIHARGETPILHASALNVNAIRLYEHLGFVTRVVTNFQFVQAPALPEQRPAADVDPDPDHDDEDEPFVRRGECG
nr:GNAT family N-acetyltransferase [Pseudofrankia sp. DC12]